MHTTRDITDLIRGSSSIDELAEVRTITGHHEKVGSVVITIRDRGIDGRSRYSVFAYAEDDVSRSFAVAGNPQPNLEDAIAMAHWNKLDEFAASLGR